MLALVLPPVSSRVSGFPVASPCLWGKLQNVSFCHVANCQNCRKSRTKCWFFCGFPVASPSLWGKLENLSFLNVSKQVVMSFCVAGVALCDIPTCLIMFRKGQNWRKSRTKCLFFCIHVSCLGSLVFLWRRRVYGGSWKTSNVSKQVVMSFCVAGVALCDIPTCLITCRKGQNWRKSRTKCWFFCIHVSCLESLVFLWRRRVYGGSWKTSPIRMCPRRLSCRFAWQAWHFVTFQPV